MEETIQSLPQELRTLHTKRWVIENVFAWMTGLGPESGVRERNNDSAGVTQIEVMVKSEVYPRTTLTLVLSLQTV
jgi:hypothetical protein